MRLQVPVRHHLPVPVQLGAREVVAPGKTISGVLDEDPLDVDLALPALVEQELAVVAVDHRADVLLEDEELRACVLPGVSLQADHAHRDADVLVRVDRPGEHLGAAEVLVRRDARDPALGGREHLDRQALTDQRQGAELEPLAELPAGVLALQLCVGRRPEQQGGAIDRALVVEHERLLLGVVLDERRAEVHLLRVEPVLHQLAEAFVHGPLGQVVDADGKGDAGDHAARLGAGVEGCGRGVDGVHDVFLVMMRRGRSGYGEKVGT